MPAVIARTLSILAMTLVMIGAVLIIPLQRAAARPGSGPDWTDCGDGLQCATLATPLDWRRPAGPTTVIELGRLPAVDQRAKRGTIVVVTGGPSPTLPVLRTFPELFAELRQSYDLVGVDPRGIGEQHHYACPNGIGTTAFASDLSAAGWRRLEQLNAAWDAGCRRSTNPVVDHLNAWQVAHDLDAVRAALGEPKLDYLGTSYGAVYAQAYLELFPRQAGRMVLDSVPDHTRTGLAALSRQRARQVEAAFGDYARWCATTTSCALHGRDFSQAWDALLTRAAKEPLPAPSAGAGVTVTADEIRLQTALLVDQPPTSPDFAKLAEAIVEAEGGDAAKFRYDSQLGDVVINRYANCADFAGDHSYQAYRRAERQLRPIAPRVGWLQARLDFARCAGLTIVDPYPTHPLRTHGAPPVLLLGGTEDVATPVADGKHVADQLPGSSFITAEGSNHGVYLRQNHCARVYVHRYFDTGRLPPRRTTCPPN